MQTFALYILVNHLNSDVAMVDVYLSLRDVTEVLFLMTIFLFFILFNLKIPNILFLVDQCNDNSMFFCFIEIFKLKFSLILLFYFR